MREVKGYQYVCQGVMIIYDCGISARYREIEKGKGHKKNGEIKGLLFLVGQKFSGT